ncbi:MAG: bifunctional aspartate kinase/homoserine dehydrogenase I [Bacteroidaceae bacterium]|nr:bifunctional aspartate kinase/homoserine dehydrogenase I [Prevotellaceae bacterium]MDY5761120.1 bifunctional aspartate kinase/homoserine dehydrogenase I [Bacteroidaceae bacterium]
MKVLKFGGTSVGSVESILNLKKIVEGQDEPVVVVVSALGGITDKLINTSKVAVAGDETYLTSYNEMVERHHQMIDAIITDTKKKETLLATVDDLLGQLKSIYQGVYLIGDLSEKTSNAIVSYGERISSNIVAALIEDAKWYNSLEFIKTKHKQGRNLFSNSVSNPLILDVFGDFKNGTTTHKVCVAGGFISTDSVTGEVTNLGRGGSDYTAAILAAALDAEVLEIWTDVSGFMTADPRVINTAYPIERLSYVEATELCNFGAKVVYPPTIYPVCIKNIPILIKNTFHPEDKGTIITSLDEDEDNGRAIKGISSINNTSLITVSGLSMVGVIGVNRRIFTTLAENGISVFMVSQASSENSTSIGVTDDDADRACEVLNKEFAKEIEMGAMYKMKLERDLATVAIVGENMKHTPGIAGKLFGTLGRNGISVIACAQGASETNISFVVERKSLRKSLNVIHDSFFLSEYQVLNVFLCGVGTVGGSLLEQIASQRQKLMKERNLQINVVGIASGHNAVFDRNGIDLEAPLLSPQEGKTPCGEFSIQRLREVLKQAPASNIKRLKEEVIGMNIFNSVFVDCTASAEVAGLYEDLLSNNISVVAANKVAASSDYDNYAKLKATARKRGVKYLFETNVGAGLPIINTINDLINSGDKILKLEAVLSGTLNFIFNKISADVPFSETVRLAKEEGYSEPDPRIDLSGKDVVRKLVILSREAGYKMNQEDVEKKLFIPQSFFEGSLDDFWKNLPSLDAQFEQERKEVEAAHEHWKFVAKLENGKGSVSLQRVGEHHPFYDLEGSNNIILITTERYNQYPMLIQGYGAGAQVTAAGVFADIMSIANI